MNDMTAQSATNGEGDSFPLSSLYFYLTDGCNLRCRHCWIQPKFQGESRAGAAIDVDLFINIIGQAKPLGLSSVKLSGGEPFIHPKIMDILSYLKDCDLRVNIETNGVACTPEIARAVALCRNPFVSISIDGATRESHEWMRGVAGSFEAAKGGIRNLVDVGIRPQVIMSIFRRNRHEIEDVAAMAADLGAESVKFNIVQPTARGAQLFESGENLTIHELVNIGAWIETELTEKYRPLRVVYSHPLAFRPLSRSFGANGDGCRVCSIFGILGVLADGSYALCGIGETVPELVFGHARTDRLADVWTRNPVLQEIRGGLPKKLTGICADCLMKNVCLGNCIAMNYYETGNLWTPYWYCAQAKEAGLFPPSRAGNLRGSETGFQSCLSE
jgi:SynChlorMet cassette radical SAM/SPASM protein ScmF